MSHVFVVEEGCIYEGGTVWGVYSELEKALTWVQSYIDYEEGYKDPSDDRWRRVDDDKPKDAEMYWMIGRNYYLSITKYLVDEDVTYVVNEGKPHE